MIITIPSRAAQQSYVLHETGYTDYVGEGTGYLSIKSFFGGQALYEVGRSRYRVGDDTYLILNHGQNYRVRIHTEKPIESFCIFFVEGFAEEVNRSLIAPSLLDDPFKSIPPLQFFEKTYTRDTLLSPSVRHLRDAIISGRATPGWLEEQLHLLMQRLLHVHDGVYREVENLSAVRPATREELYRRLHCAKDYASALFDTAITLAEIADVACLSPNHLLRTFKQVFGQTPHQFITTKRLEAAQYLLLCSERSITEICFAVGFESLGSFSWLFSRRFGLSPSEFRRQKR
jgi:AraC family transcriptional regulator